MIKKLKRVLTAVLCVCAISASMFAIPTRAADSEHVCTKDMAVMVPGSKIGPQSYEYVSDMYHNTKYHALFSCSVCGRSLGYWDIYEQEIHKYTLYEGQGHSGQEHTYKIICGSCRGSKSITIKCLYNTTGKHTTPW